eukprot:675325-Rhodomonas_salina.1
MCALVQQSMQLLCKSTSNRWSVLRVPLAGGTVSPQTYLSSSQTISSRDLSRDLETQSGPKPGHKLYTHARHMRGLHVYSPLELSLLVLAKIPTGLLSTAVLLSFVCPHVGVLRLQARCVAAYEADDH